MRVIGYVRLSRDNKGNGHSLDAGSLKKVDSTTFIRSLAAEGLSAATITRIYGQYKSVILHALDEGYISNPNVISKKVKVPTDAKLGRKEFKPRFLTVAELDRLAEAAAVFHPDYGLLIRFLGMTGLRVGECAALTVGDLRLYLDRRAEVSVSKTAAMAPGGGMVAASPKTESSERTVTLPPSLASLMSAYLDRHPAKADADSPAPPSAPLWCGREPGSHYASDWIPKYGTSLGNLTDEELAAWRAQDPMRKHCAFVPFPDSEEARKADPMAGFRPLDGSRGWDPGVFYKSMWGRVVGIAGLAPLRMHDLRHTAASLMLASGMSMLEVSEQLGHADSAITAKVYAHVLPTEVVRSSERYDAWLAAERERATDTNVVRLRHG